MTLSFEYNWWHIKIYTWVNLKDEKLSYIKLCFIFQVHKWNKSWYVTKMNRVNCLSHTFQQHTCNICVKGNNNLLVALKVTKTFFNSKTARRKITRSLNLEKIFLSAWVWNKAVSIREVTKLSLFLIYDFTVKAWCDVPEL